MSNATLTAITQTAQHAQIGVIAGLPLLGSALAFFVGRKNRDAAGWIATAAAALSFVWVLKLFFGLTPDHYFEQQLAVWFASPEFLSTGFSVDFLLRFDQLTAVMCLIITGIGSLIHLYSVGYMAEDESRHRFFCYLNLFLFSMLTLVLGGNLLVLFIGWEGVGLCSYLLIGFWFKNLAYAGAGRKAFVVNRIGDAGMLLAMFLLIQQFGTLDFVQLKSLISGHTAFAGLMAVVAACLFIGATGKSAQIPLFVWLPDAMAGPTPVSALIHAATMVTSGLYLMARTHFIFDLAPTVMSVIVLIAVLTAFIAATTALAQNDIKKVLAYSTVSQLGFMFMAAGMGAYWIAIFHVITHAFFKGCLFLGAGSVIMGCHHEQDMRKLGGLSKLMPITFATYLVSTLAISGIYPFAGFQSKHAILETLSGHDNPLHIAVQSWLPLVAAITAFLTAFYVTRSLAITFFGTYRGGSAHHDHHDSHAKHDDHSHSSHGAHTPHESPWNMTLPLIVLAAGAAGVGLWLQTALPEFLSPVLPRAHAHESVSILEGIKASWMGILGFVLAIVMYTKLQVIPKTLASVLFPLEKLFAGKWYFDELYAALVVRPLEGASHVLWTIVDASVIDGTVNGTGKIVDINGEWLRGAQTGQIRHYMLLMFSAAVVMLIFCFML